ncbi:MAG: YHS domain-containing protein [Deltaproteobacteria bacterium]|nr:YHS domain-containing protein [Deltaproteobacteria bacterium]
MRLLLLLLLGYLLYRTVRRYLRSGQNLEHHEGTDAIDEMVQDPVCKTYVPVREAEKRVIGGRAYYFCSKKCADEFQRQSKS